MELFFKQVSGVEVQVDYLVNGVSAMKFLMA